MLHSKVSLQCQSKHLSSHSFKKSGRLVCEVYYPELDRQYLKKWLSLTSPLGWFFKLYSKRPPARHGHMQCILLSKTPFQFYSVHKLYSTSEVECGWFMFKPITHLIDGFLLPGRNNIKDGKKTISKALTNLMCECHFHFWEKLMPLFWRLTLKLIFT